MSEVQERPPAVGRPLAAATALDADLTADLVRRAVAGMAVQSSEANVVVLDQRHVPVRCTVISAALVARVADRAPDEALLRDIVRLDAFTPAVVVDLATPEGAAANDLPLGSVVVRGAQVLGVVVSDEGTRGAPAPAPRPGWAQGQAGAPPRPLPAPAGPAAPPAAAPLPPAAAPMPAPAAPMPAPAAPPMPAPAAPMPAPAAPMPTPAAPPAPAPAPAAPPMVGADPGDGGPVPVSDSAAAPPPDLGLDDAAPPDAAAPDDAAASPDDAAPGAEPAGAPPPTRRFEAFPHTEAPAEIAAGVQFSLVVGFTQERPTQPTAATPVTVLAAPPAMAFEVQVAGFGFDFPAGVTFPLRVTRDAPTESVQIPVIARSVPASTSRSLQVTYAFGGAVVGEAWSTVLVRPADAPDEGTAPTGAVTAGGTGVGSMEAQPPDLTVTIRTTPGRPEIEWLFQTPHEVTRPTDRVQTSFEQGTAEAFATQLMEQLPAGKDKPLLTGDVGGLGLRVAAAYPPEFWQTVDAVWRTVGKDAVPTMLLITGEPFVPWELALMEPDRHVGADLLDPDDRLPMLGALWAIGRWLAPVRQPFGPDRPSAPPDELVDAPTMVVVKGDYRGGGVTALPGAVRESEELALAYQAVVVSIDEQSVTDLMDDRVVDEASQPYHPVVVHFAAHGQVGTTHQQHTGIVLDNRRLLGPLAIEASALGRATKPFVFLNACQVGVAAYMLNGYGGLASAFVMSGARGFVAPLWNVDDDLAHVLSAAFYQRVLDRGESVGEALRQMRRGFVEGGGRTATPLAYVFYGHPRLRLTRQVDR